MSPLICSSLGCLGIFILNLVCRDSALRKDVLERVSGVFPAILSRKIDGEVNEVLLCRRQGEGIGVLPSLKQAGHDLQRALHSGVTHSPKIDVAELLKDMKVV